jgi:hypothetical protein
MVDIFTSPQSDLKGYKGLGLESSNASSGILLYYILWYKSYPGNLLA